VYACVSVHNVYKCGSARRQKKRKKQKNGNINFFFYCFLFFFSPTHRQSNNLKKKKKNSTIIFYDTFPTVVATGNSIIYLPIRVRTQYDVYIGIYNYNAYLIKRVLSNEFVIIIFFFRSQLPVFTQSKTGIYNTRRPTAADSTETIRVLCVPSVSYTLYIFICIFIYTACVQDVERTSAEKN